jgi:hypothetical protein
VGFRAGDSDGVEVAAGTDDDRHGPARPGHRLTHLSELTVEPIEPDDDEKGAISAADSGILLPMAAQHDDRCPPIQRQFEPVLVVRLILGSTLTLTHKCRWPRKTS